MTRFKRSPSGLGWQATAVLFMALMFNAGPLAAQVVATLVPSKFGDAQEFLMKVFNNTQRALYVVVDFSYACGDGSSGSDSITFQIVGPNNSAEWPLRQCFTRGNSGEGGSMIQATVLNKRWQLANYELEHDAAVAEAAARAERIRQSEAAMAEENRRQEERRKRKRCSVDDRGHFELEKVAFGRVPRECHQWFPEMHEAIARYEAEERQRREDGQRRLREVYRQQELDKQQRQMQADRAKLEAVQRQDALDRKREQQAAVQAQETARAQQAALERDAAEANERARAYRSDPCGAVADMRTRPPQAQPHPPGQTASARAKTDQYNAQLLAQWQQALAAQERACANANAARSGQADVKANAAAEAQRAAQLAAQEAQRQRNLQSARDDLDRVNAQGRENRIAEQQRNQKVQDENELLRELMERMK